MSVLDYASVTPEFALRNVWVCPVHHPRQEVVPVANRLADPIAEALDEVRLYTQAKHAATDKLAVEILRERDDGQTVRALAERYGVAPSAVHNWTQRGRALAAGKVRPCPHPRHGAPSVVLPVVLQWLLVGLLVACFVDRVIDLAVL
jgi:hypothetical protein